MLTVDYCGKVARCLNLGSLHVWLKVVDWLRALLDVLHLFSKRGDRCEELTVESKTVFL